MVAFGFLLPNFVRWWEPTNDTLSFCKCRLSRGHSNPTCCMQIGLSLLHSGVPCAPRSTIFITDRKGKVMFSQVFVCPQSASWLLIHCLALLRRGQYASYWNAFLFFMQPSLCFLDISQPLMYLWSSYKILVHLSCHTCFTMSSCYNVVRPYILVRPITSCMAQTLDKKIDEAGDNPKKE